MKTTNSIEMYGTFFRLPKFAKMKDGKLVSNFTIKYTNLDDRSDVVPVDCMAVGECAKKILQFCEFYTWCDEIAICGKLKTQKMPWGNYTRLMIVVNDFVLCNCKALNGMGYTRDTYYQAVPNGIQNKNINPIIDRGCNNFELDCMIHNNEMPSVTEENYLGTLNWNKKELKKKNHFYGNEKGSFDYSWGFKFGNSADLNNLQIGDCGYFKVSGRIKGKKYISKNKECYEAYLELETIEFVGKKLLEESDVVLNIPLVHAGYDDFVASKGYESWEEYYEYSPVF